MRVRSPIISVTAFISKVLRCKSHARGSARAGAACFRENANFTECAISPAIHLRNPLLRVYNSRFGTIFHYVTMPIYTKFRLISRRQEGARRHIAHLPYDPSGVCRVDISVIKNSFSAYTIRLNFVKTRPRILSGLPFAHFSHVYFHVYI